MLYLIDTDRVIDALQGVQPIQQLIQSLLPDGIAISIITYSEVYEGIYGSRDPQKAEQGFQAFLQSIRILLITHRVARQAAETRNDLRSRRLQTNHRALDLFIASTALTYNLTLVTGNVKRFNDITGLTVL